MKPWLMYYESIYREVKLLVDGNTVSMDSEQRKLNDVYSAVMTCC